MLSILALLRLLPLSDDDDDDVQSTIIVIPRRWDWPLCSLYYHTTHTLALGTELLTKLLHYHLN